MKRVQQAAATLAALALTAAITLPAGAVDTTSSNMVSVTTLPQSASHNIIATYQPDTYYHVDITWGSLEFTYEPGVWMGNQHSENEELTYQSDNGKKMGWNNENKTGGNNHIHIENKSNANVGINLKFDITNEECTDRVTGAFWDQYTKKTITKNTSTDLSSGFANNIWMERADKNVYQLDENNIATDEGTASVADLYLNLLNRPRNALQDAVIGTVTITLSEDTTYDNYEIYYESGVTYTAGGKKPVTKRDDLGKGGMTS